MLCYYIYLFSSSFCFTVACSFLMEKKYYFKHPLYCGTQLSKFKVMLYHFILSLLPSLISTIACSYPMVKLCCFIFILCSHSLFICLLAVAGNYLVAHHLYLSILLMAMRWFGRTREDLMKISWIYTYTVMNVTKQ